MKINVKPIKHKKGKMMKLNAITPIMDKAIIDRKAELDKACGCSRSKEFAVYSIINEHIERKGETKWKV